MSKNITIKGANVYHSYPESDTKGPGLILIEEIWGVNDHIKNVADRFAKEGYRVLAPELLPEGLLEQLTPQVQKDLFDPEKRNEVQPKLRAAMQPIMQPEYARSTLEILVSCIDYLLIDPHVSKKVGVVGFCFGGTYSFHLAASDSRIQAAVPFYGQSPAQEEIAGINCPILAFYGDQDANLMQTLPNFKEEMKKQKKSFEAIVYEGMGHAFFNDTNSRTYNARVAQDAWGKTLAFLAKHLS
ncbi:MAG: dienelactone hydrolase family protein [Patescibacteria group bacterium]|nr:dienelactone hydrolase family protein [Patescibacteria group bacterium]